MVSTLESGEEGVRNRGGVAVERELKRRKLSQRAFAQKIGTTSGPVCRWISGQRIPNTYFSQKILAELGVDPRLFLQPIGAKGGTAPGRRKLND